MSNPPGWVFVTFISPSCGVLQSETVSNEAVTGVVEFRDILCCFQMNLCPISGEKSRKSAPDNAFIMDITGVLGVILFIFSDVIA